LRVPFVELISNYEPSIGSGKQASHGALASGSKQRKSAKMNTLIGFDGHGHTPTYPGVLSHFRTGMLIIIVVFLCLHYITFLLIFEKFSRIDTFSYH